MSLLILLAGDAGPTEDAGFTRAIPLGMLSRLGAFGVRGGFTRAIPLGVLSRLGGTAEVGGWKPPIAAYCNNTNRVVRGM